MLFSHFIVLDITIAGFLVVKGSVVLLPSPAIAAERESFILTCTYSGSETVSGFIWLLNGNTLAVILIPTCTPFVNPGPPDSSLYNYACSSDKQSTFTVKQISNRNNGNNWQCAVAAPRYIYSNNVTVIVQVSVSRVSLSPPTSSIVENIETTFTCATSASRPASDITWYKETTKGQTQMITSKVSSTTQNVADLEKSTSVLKYTPKKVDNGHKIYCEASNIPGKKVMSSKFAINVQYKPDSLRFIVNRITTSGPISFIDGKARSVVCESNGNPNPDSYSWQKAGGSVKKVNTLTLNPVKKQDDSQYTCTANNTMVPSRGAPKIGSSSSTVKINVLYHPKIEKLEDKGIVAGSNLSLHCPLTEGNPSSTTFKWTRGGDSRTWNSQILDLHNITKNDDMIYTCTAQNIMIPTGGPQELCTDRKSFHLNVLYTSTITSFAVKGNEDTSSVIVNENENVTFVCIVDDKPTPSVELAFEGEVIYSRNNTNSEFYNRKASCLDAGIYTCSARNPFHYGNEASEKLELRVRCSPRPLRQMKVNFTSSLNDTANLTFTTLAYPEPGINGFNWYKQNSFTWIPLLSNTDLIITTSGLHTSLTIKRVFTSDFGNYRVTVTNVIGKYDQYLYLVEKKEKISTEIITDFDKTGQKSDNTGLIVSVTLLGVLLAVVTIYAIILTLYLRRKLMLEETHISTSAKHTTYANICYQTEDKKETYSRPSGDVTTAAIGHDNDDSNQQYTDLVHYSNEDQKTYDVIIKT